MEYGSAVIRAAFIKRAWRPALAAVAASALVLLTGIFEARAQESFAERQALAAKFGVEIPTKTVNIGMAPFGDHLILSAAMGQGWFEDVGITVGPRKFSTIDIGQVTALLLNKNYDVTTQYVPLQLQNMVSAPQIKQFTFSDTYVGLFILAPPRTSYETVHRLVHQGVPFGEAVKRVVGQLKGKRFAVDDTGAHRAFVDGVFRVGGITAGDLSQVLTVDDSRMLLLAKGGQIDFCLPLGGAQEVQLLLEGWYPILGAEDLIAGLPAGDPTGVTGIGHTGLATTEGMWKNDPDTILRVAGVEFRVIDQIKADVANGSDNALKHILPVLRSAAALDLSMKGLRLIYSVVDPMKSFEEQSEYWLESDNPFYYKNVYGPQIKALKQGGVLPANSDVTADSVIIGREVYQALLENKKTYESLLPQASGLTGDRAKLAQLAAVHYANRNYLDARRFLKAAVSQP